MLGRIPLGIELMFVRNLGKLFPLRLVARIGSSDRFGSADVVGLDLTFTAIELDIHVIRVLRGEMTFVEIRGWFAARLAPIARRPWPPLRTKPKKR